MSAGANGQRPPDPDEQQDRREDMQAASAGWETAAREHERAQSIQESFLEDLIDTTDLADPSRDKLNNLVSKDFPLANFTDDEVHELKYRLRIRLEMFLRAHPRPESGVTDDTRKIVNDDPTDGLKPLTQGQKYEALQIFDAIWARVTRGRGMAQQEILQKSITESRVQRGTEENDDEGSGLLSRLR